MTSEQPSLTDKILSLLPDDLDPGTELPNLDRIYAKIEGLKRQDIVVEVLCWVMDNRDWLPLCNFSLQLDDQRVYLCEDEVAWDSEAKEPLIGDGDLKVSELVEYLDDAVGGSTENTVQRVIDRMNGCAWDPKKALEALSTVFSYTPSGEKCDVWLARHYAAHEAAQIEEKTAPQKNAASPRRRI